MQNDKICGLMTICRKAGKLMLGFDASKEAVLGGMAKCIMLSADVSPKTRKEISFYAEKYGVNVINLEMSMEDIALKLRKKTAVMAVCDEGFAKKFGELSLTDIKAD